MGKLPQPASMEDCVYFTRRTLDTKGRAVAWVLRGNCPKCKKGVMAKPRNPNGGVKIRATEYACMECGHTIEKMAYEDTLTMNIEYTCPHCGKSGEIQTPYKRRTFEGVPCVVFECGACKRKIGISKKMKASKKKGAPELDDDV